MFPCFLHGQHLGEIRHMAMSWNWQIFSNLSLIKDRTSEKPREMESFIINTIVVLFIGKSWEDRVATWDLEGDILNWNILPPARLVKCVTIWLTNIHILQGRLFWLRAAKGKGVKFSRNLVLSNLQHQYRYILFSIFNVNITAISTIPLPLQD